MRSTACRSWRRRQLPDAPSEPRREPRRSSGEAAAAAPGWRRPRARTARPDRGRSGWRARRDAPRRDSRDGRRPGYRPRDAGHAAMAAAAPRTAAPATSCDHRSRGARSHRAGMNSARSPRARQHPKRSTSSMVRWQDSPPWIARAAGVHGVAVGDADAAAAAAIGMECRPPEAPGAPTEQSMMAVARVIPIRRAGDTLKARNTSRAAGTPRLMKVARAAVARLATTHPATTQRATSHLATSHLGTSAPPAAMQPMLLRPVRRPRRRLPLPRLVRR